MLTKDLPANYTKSGLEEILRNIEPLMTFVNDRGIDWCPEYEAAKDAYWKWYENEQKRHRVG